jgi:hypothetical protein
MIIRLRVDERTRYVLPIDERFRECQSDGRKAARSAASDSATAQSHAAARRGCALANKGHDTGPFKDGLVIAQLLLWREVPQRSRGSGLVRLFFRTGRVPPNLVRGYLMNRPTTIQARLATTTPHERQPAVRAQLSPLFPPGGVKPAARLLHPDDALRAGLF